VATDGTRSTQQPPAFVFPELSLGVDKVTLDTFEKQRGSGSDGGMMSASLLRGERQLSPRQGMLRLSVDARVVLEALTSGRPAVLTEGWGCSCASRTKDVVPVCSTPQQLPPQAMTRGLASKDNFGNNLENRTMRRIDGYGSLSLTKVYIKVDNISICHHFGAWHK
jgi:hypothetical protein